MASAFTNGAISLYTPPKIHVFNRSQQANLLVALDRLETNSHIQQLTNVTELQLNADATTKQGRHRYTSLAFKQIASLLGPGAGRILPDLSGTRRRDIPDAHLSGALAVHVFNALLDLRFEPFKAYRLIRNLETNYVEGLIGNKHQYLQNSQFMRSLTEAVEAAAVPTNFYAARLIGRQLFVWWRAARPFLSLPLGGNRWDFYRGYYACNGESAGLSVRASCAIFTPAGVCLGPYRTYGVRISHRGKKFVQRLSSELGKVVSRQLPEDEWRQQISPALEQTLGFTIGSNPRALKQRWNVLAALLRRLGVDYNLANEVLQQTITFGRDIGGRDILPLHQTDRLYASRTALDLLICLLHTARRLDMSRREKLEQVGFHIITGKFF